MTGPGTTRRRFLLGLGALSGAAALAACSNTAPPGTPAPAGTPAADHHDHHAGPGVRG